MPYSFADQIAADADAQISTREWAETATYTSPAGDAMDIVTVCQGEQLVDNVTVNGKEQVRQNLFSIKIAQVSSPLVNAVITYNGERWPLVGIASRDSAVVVVICELPTQGSRVGGSQTARVNSFSYRRM